MHRISILICIGLFQAGSLLVNSGETEDVCHFINGDTLTGRLISFSKEDGLSWQSAASKVPFLLLPEAIDHIELAGKEPSTTNKNNAVIELTNGDSLPAQLLDLDEKEMKIATTYAGPITLDPAMVQTILPRNMTAGLIVHGVGPLSDWILSPVPGQKWTSSRGSIETDQAAWISRKVALPDRCSIEFTAQWASTPNFRFSFMMADPARADRQCYNLTVQPTYIRLYRRDANGRTASLSNQFYRIRPASKSRFQIIIDKKLGTIMLYINQQHVLTGRDGATQSGQGIQFRNSMPQKFSVSDLRISHHSGAVSGKSSIVVPEGQDSLQLANDDRIAGQVTGLTDGNISIKTTFAEMKVPLDRVTRILFDSASRAQQRRNRMDVRGHFSKEGNITLRLDGITNGQLSGYSENYGTVTTPLRSLRSLHLNLYRPETPPSE